MRIKSNRVAGVLAGLLASLALTVASTVPSFADEVNPNHLKVALVLGGGGTRGAAHVGVLKVLTQAGIPIDSITGTSMGAIVGGMYCAGLPLSDIESKFTDVSLMKSYMTVSVPVRMMAIPLFAIPHLFGWHPYDGFYFGNKFAKFMNNCVPENMREVANLKTPLRAVATDLVDGKAYVLTSGEFGRVLQASSAVPILRRPLELQGHLFVDGALVSNVPVKEAKETNPDVIIAVNVDERFSNVPMDTFRKIGSVSKRTLDLYLHQEDQASIKSADIVIHPEVDGIKLISTNQKDAVRAIAAGEKAAREALPAILARLSSGKAAGAQTSSTDVSGLNRQPN